MADRPKPDPPARSPQPFDGAFMRRTAFQLGAVVALLAVWKLADVLLATFGAVIVAVVLHSLADPLRRHGRLSPPLALTASALIIVGVLAGSGWLFGATFSDQLQDLAQRMPHSMEELRALVATLPFGDQLAGQFGTADGIFAQLGGLAGRLGGYAINLAGALTTLFLVLVAGLYLAIHPAQAREGMLLLVPRTGRERAREAVEASGAALRLWLMGVFADMVVVGVLTALGTWLIGLPAPGALGLLAGLAAFVPIVGPTASAIPGVLVALPSGPQMVLWTVLVYVAVQQVESNLFYPFIQRRAVDLPPVLTLLGVFAFGVLFGPLGVMLATPLLVVLYVLIKMLYVRDVLGEEVRLPGQPGPRRR